MRKFAVILVLSSVSAAAVILLGLSIPASALSIFDGVNAAQGNGTPSTLFSGSGGTGVVTVITNTLLFLAGALSVIMIIIGGLRYTISGGNSANVTAAKNTILYAIVGLIIAFLAFAIINWITVGVIGAGGEGVGASDV